MNYSFKQLITNRIDSCVFCGEKKVGQYTGSNKLFQFEQKTVQQTPAKEPYQNANSNSPIEIILQEQSLLSISLNGHKARWLVTVGEQKCLKTAVKSVL